MKKVLFILSIGILASQAAAMDNNNVQEKQPSCLTKAFVVAVSSIGYGLYAPLYELGDLFDDLTDEGYNPNFSYRPASFDTVQVAYISYLDIKNLLLERQNLEQDVNKRRMIECKKNSKNLEKFLRKVFDHQCLDMNKV